jgi:putative integral membrane protein (TIGR02587 family)
MNESAFQTSCRPIAESLQEYGRGVAGGFLFSLPLLYTMEVWWAGFTLHPARLAAGVLATFVLLLGYNRYAGLHSGASFAEVLTDSVEEMGLGLLLATFILWLLERITLEMRAEEVVGKIVIEAMVVAIGVSVGTAQLGSGPDSDSQVKEETVPGTHGDPAAPKTPQEPHYVGQMAIALCGAVLIAANVGPTEEIVMLGVEISPLKLRGCIALAIDQHGLTIDNGQKVENRL